MYLDENGEVINAASRRGYLAVGVPGTVKGLDYALDKYGQLSRQQVMALAIALAKEEWPLQPAEVYLLNRSQRKLNNDPAAANIFLNEGQA